MTGKLSRRDRIKKGIRKRISGSSERPRLSVYRSNKGIYAQIIDDVTGKTIVSASSLSKDFVALVFISLLIATPTAYYFMHSWLQNYQYRTEISWWIFAATALGAVGISMLTVSFQAIRAAIANPVKSLRSE